VVSDTMPAMSQPTASNFRVLQIADAASPKVAAFAVAGQTFDGVSFATTHAGTAQYLIAGLSPGAYKVTVNGSVVVSSQQVVDADNTLYFESTSGNVVIASTNSTANPCDLNNDGVVNSEDVSLELNVALGIAGSCTSAFDLNKDGLCNVIDLQRVINAALGMACRVGQ